MIDRDGHLSLPQHEDASNLVTLLDRYDRPGPRYTSYPTAVEFHDGIDATHYAQALSQANERADAPLSIYAHLPFCKERCWFCGCHVIVSPKEEKALPYLDDFHREVALVASHLPDRRGLSQLHLGGGTPTYYPPEILKSAVESVLSSFHILDGAELAIEVDPRVTTDAHLETLSSLGFNRISMGVQDTDPAVQEAIGRRQSLRETEEMIKTARRLGFAGINVDLIYGLPRQDASTWASTLETVIGLGVDRVAVYSFAYIPWMKRHQASLSEKDLPDRHRKHELFAAAREGFLAAGYETIGMDHFARPDDELAKAKRERRLKRNFQGYTVIPAEDVIGFGISAIGDLGGSYVQNFKKWSQYRSALDRNELPVERGIFSNEDDLARRAIIHDLMCHFLVDLSAMERRFGFEFENDFAQEARELEALEDEGLVRWDGRILEATPVGEIFVRNIAMVFDRYYRDKHRGDANRFSRTV